MTNRKCSRGIALGVAAAALLCVAAACGVATWPTAPAATPRAAAPAAACCDDPAPPPAPAPRKRVLHISADPNNLPFTNDRREGFENKIADVIAAELGMEIEYHWRAQRRGFFRQSLKEYEADLVLGVPVGFDLATTTAPYYRSTYVFVTKADGGPKVASLDDPVLKTLRIGVQMIGNDGANTPPAHALAARGLIGNVTGFMIYGDYREPNPPARVIDAVAKGEVDVSIAWGPMAGYFAKRSPVPLTVTPVTPAVDPPGLPMTFGISLGVRRGNTALRDTLDAILKKRKPDIDRILDEYGVPRVAKPGQP